MHLNIILYLIKHLKFNNKLNIFLNKHIKILTKKNQYLNNFALICEEISIINESRGINLKLLNQNLLSYTNLYIGIYISILQDEVLNRLGNDKVVISTDLTESGREFNLHNNIHFGKDFSLPKYLNLCAPNIQYLSELNYFAEDIVYVQVKV
jgi:hypothetical protein